MPDNTVVFDPSGVVDGETIEFEDDVIRLKAGGSMILVDEIILASAGNEVNFTGLDIDADGIYFLISKIIGNGSPNAISIYANNDTTGANYDRERLKVTGGSVSASAGVDAQMCDIVSGSIIVYSHIGMTADYFMAVESNGNEVSFAGAGRINTSVVVSKAAVSGNNITQLNLRASDANGFQIGSKFTLYKVG